MAFSETPLSSSLRVYVNDGTSASGSPKLKSMTLFSGLLKPELSSSAKQTLLSVVTLVEPVLLRQLTSDENNPVRLTEIVSLKDV